MQKLKRKKNRKLLPKVLNPSLGVIIQDPKIEWVQPWTQEPYKNLTIAMGEILQQSFIRQAIAQDHLKKTPIRMAKAFYELTEGYREDPIAILKTGFTKGTYNEMIICSEIDFCSLCAHHVLPFVGQAHFAYLPRKTIVGLSKIPRMVEALARRLQVQEDLSEQIVDIFQKTVKPLGCGIVIEASHMCASIRGVKKERMRMRTTALRGLFLKDPTVKSEFFSSINNRRH